MEDFKVLTSGNARRAAKGSGRLLMTAVIVALAVVMLFNGF